MVVGVQQVDADEVGECGHAHVGQLLRRVGDVECGADAHAGLVDQLQPLAGEVLLGEVVGADADAAHPAVGVGEGRDAGVPRMGPALPGGLQVGVHVVAVAGGQHPAQVPLQLRVLGPAADVGGPQPAQPVGRQAEQPRHGVVHGAQPQPVVEDHGGAGRLGERRPDQRVVVVVGAFVARGDGEPGARSVVPGRSAVGEHPDGHRPSVAVPQRQGAAPPLLLGAGRQAVRAVGQQVGRGASHDVRGRVAQQKPGALVPLAQGAGVVDDGAGRGVILGRVDRTHRRHSIAHTHGEQRVTWAPA